MKRVFKYPEWNSYFFFWKDEDDQIWCNSLHFEGDGTGTKADFIGCPNVLKIEPHKVSPNICNVKEVGMILISDIKYCKHPHSKAVKRLQTFVDTYIGN